MSCCLQVFNGKATVKQLVQNWSISYVGNMIGASIIIALMCGGAVFPYQPPGLLKMAIPKVSLTFKQVGLASIAYQHHYTHSHLERMLTSICCWCPPSPFPSQIHLCLSSPFPLSNSSVPKMDQFFGL